MKLFKIISRVAAVILLAALIWYLIQGIRGCEKAVREIVTPTEEKEDLERGSPQPMEIKQRLFGQDDKPRLEIIIPPSEDTTRLWVPGGEQVYTPSENVQLRVIKHQPAIIRLKPTFHVTALTDISQVYFGVKVRVIEIWRFGLCGYVTTCGPGIGCDFRIISNVSIGVVKTLDKVCGEVSIRL